MDDHLSGPSQDTIGRVRRVFVESLHLKVGHAELSYERMLEEAASLDSIAVLEVLTAVEREFGISLEPEFLEFDFLRDLAGLAAYIDDRLGRQRE
jgi:acyl carrier protein